MKNLISEIIEQINNFGSNEIVNLNNTYAQNVNYSEDEIYINDEDFFNTFFYENSMEAVRAASYGDYNYHHEYVKFNGYGNLVTMDAVTVEDLCDSVENIAEHVCENFEEYKYIFSIQEAE